MSNSRRTWWGQSRDPPSKLLDPPKQIAQPVCRPPRLVLGKARHLQLNVNLKQIKFKYNAIPTWHFWSILILVIKIHLIQCRRSCRHYKNYLSHSFPTFYRCRSLVL